MMRDDIARVMRLVKEGKLSPEDAAELIDAMQGQSEQGATGSVESDSSSGAASSESRTTPPPPPPPPQTQSGSTIGFGSFFDAVEKFGKEISGSVNWTEVGDQLRKGVREGTEALKKAAGDLKIAGVAGLFDSESRVFEQPIVVPQGKTLKVETTHGDVRIKVDPQATGNLRASAVFRGADREALRERADAFTLAVEESDYFVLVRPPAMSGLSLDFEIVLPEAVPVEVKTESGDVSLSGGRGACRVQTLSGNVNVSAVDGSLEVSAASGDIQIASSQLALLTLDARSGNVSLSEVHGAINLRSASGDVHLRQVSGKSLAVEAVSGDVFVDLSQPVDGSVSIRTVNGLVSCEISEASDCRVHLSTLRGNLEVALPLKDEVRDSKRVTGQLGSGTGTLDVSAVNGDLFLRLRDSTA